jgi:hypothetical protein
LMGAFRLFPGFTQYAELVFVRCINLIHTHEVAKVFLSLKLPFQSTVSAFLIVFMETPVVFKCSLIWLICCIPLVMFRQHEHSWYHVRDEESDGGSWDHLSDVVSGEVS